MALEITVSDFYDPNCLFCGPLNVFTNLAQSYGLEFFKASAGLGAGAVAAALTLVWSWQIGRGIYGAPIDKARLADVSLFCVLAGGFMTAPEELFNLLWSIYGFAVNLSAKAFAVTGADIGAGDGSMAELASAAVSGILGAIGPTLESMMEKGSIFSNPAVLVAAALLLVMAVILTGVLTKYFLTPFFVVFAVSAAAYVLLLLSVFAETRRTSANAARIAAAASLQLVYASVCVSFSLAIIAAVGRLAKEAAIASFGPAYVMIVVALAVMIYAVPAMMAVPGQLFDTILDDSGKLGMWKLKKLRGG